MDPIWNALLPVITLILGAGGTLLAEGLRDSRQKRDEALTREYELLQEQREKREAFELEVLKSSYQTLVDLARAATRYHLLDREVAKAIGTDYASRQLTGLEGEVELGEALRLANASASSDAHLLLDEAIRHEALSTIRLFALLGTTIKTVAAADSELDRALIALDNVLQLIAAQIRRLYTPSMSPTR